MRSPYHLWLLAVTSSVLGCQTVKGPASSVKTICGTNNLQPVAATVLPAPWTKEFVASHAPSVAVIEERRNRRRFCTGFLIAPEVLLTANHCVDGRKAQDIAVTFGYELAADGTPAAGARAFAVSQIMETGSEQQDYALLRLQADAGGSAAGAVYPPLKLSFDPAPLGAPVLVIQHPGGGYKHAAAGHLGAMSGERLTYADVDTESSSSGAPVLNADGAVLGVHTNGGCTATGGANKAISMGGVFKVSPYLNPAVISPLATTLPAAIPDNSALGVRLQKTVADRGPVAAISLAVQLTHGSPRDITIVLVSPTGRRIAIRDRGVDGRIGLNEFRYPEGRAPLDSFDLLKNEPSAGVWQLIVSDRNVGLKGEVLSWDLTINP